MALDSENKNLFDVVGTRPIRPDGIETVSYTHLTLPTKRIV